MVHYERRGRNEDGILEIEKCAQSQELTAAANLRHRLKMCDGSCENLKAVVLLCVVVEPALKNPSELPLRFRNSSRQSSFLSPT